MDQIGTLNMTEVATVFKCDVTIGSRSDASRTGHEFLEGSSRKNPSDMPAIYWDTVSQMHALRWRAHHIFMPQRFENRYLTNSCLGDAPLQRGADLLHNDDTVCDHSKTQAGSF